MNSAMQLDPITFEAAQQIKEFQGLWNVIFDGRVPRPPAQQFARWLRVFGSRHLLKAVNRAGQKFANRQITDADELYRFVTAVSASEKKNAQQHGNAVNPQAEFAALFTERAI